ncbi:hypothetical protein AGMMS49921_04930 [Endomicrobiia bacterium]|nr:hypothetical protein AGMMS49921_04930 [Endomicrobiia bacterium]
MKKLGHFSYKGEKLGQGRDNVKTYLIANSLIAEEIETKIRQKAFGENEKNAEEKKR